MNNSRISYSPNMAALIANRYVAEEEAEDPVPYYPSRRHLQQRLAPEKTLGVRDLQALANAQRLAMEQGLLPPEVARYILPMAMVEGRPKNYGTMNNNRFYASPQNIRILQAMGLPVGAEDAPFRIQRDQRGDKFLHMNPNVVTGEDARARLMAAILAMKGQGRSPEEAVMRYNGRGEQARHYLGKVQTAFELLNHQTNAQFRRMFENFLRPD